MTINIEITDFPDTARLATLHQSCFAPGWDAQAFAALLASRGTVALLADGGFALLRCIAGEAEILTLGVEPAARRRGMARALVAAALTWATNQGAKAVFLEVRESNEAAIALYRNAGFTQCGRRKEYYRDAQGRSEHAIVMQHGILD